MQMRISSMESPVGILYVARNDKGICALDFALEQAARFETALKKRFPNAEFIPSTESEPALKQLQEYFAGSRQKFDLPLDLLGTLFQLKIWEELLKIPYGSVISYGKLAEISGYPRAARAVGMAMATNPVPIIVPCHRVISSNGGLGGYTGSLSLKKLLLEREGVQLG